VKICFSRTARQCWQVPHLDHMTVTTTPHIGLVEADDDVRENIRVLLHAAGASVLSFRSGGQFLAAWDSAPEVVECLYLDLRATGRGADLIQTLHDAKAAVPIIGMALPGNVAAAVRAMRLGALTVLEKPLRDEEILTSLQQAQSLQERGRALFEQRQHAAQRIETLTPREGQVLELMVAGLPNRQIAESLGISPKTLDIHRANVMDKMQARTSAELVRLRLLARADARALPLLFPA
jgi:FixJ family two-component response regulator